MRLKERNKELEDRVVDGEKRVVDVEAELSRERSVNLLKEGQLEAMQNKIEEQRELLMKEVREECYKEARIKVKTELAEEKQL